MVNLNLPFSRREQFREHFRNPISLWKDLLVSGGCLSWHFLLAIIPLGKDFHSSHRLAPDIYPLLREIKMGWRCWSTAWTLRRGSFKHRRGAGWGIGWRILGETWAWGLWAHGWKCWATVPHLQKNHFNSCLLDIPVSFNATMRCRVPQISFITHCNNSIHHKYSSSNPSPSLSLPHRSGGWEVQQESKPPYHSNISLEIG